MIIEEIKERAEAPEAPPGLLEWLFRRALEENPEGGAADALSKLVDAGRALDFLGGAGGWYQ